MNMYSMLLFVSTGLCSLLRAADAPKDVVKEAKKAAATVHILASPERSYMERLSPKPSHYADLPNGCLMFEYSSSGARQHDSSYSSRPYWADFPGAGYSPR